MPPSILTEHRWALLVRARVSAALAMDADPTSGNRGTDQSTAVRLGLKSVAMKIARPHEQLVVITSVAELHVHDVLT